MKRQVHYLSDHLHYRKLLFLGSLLFLFTCILMSCKEGSIHTPIGNDSSVPGQITHVKVKNMSGSVKITYQIPPNEGILYVQAAVDLGKKTIHQKSIYYQNSITLRGFAASKTYKVKLTTVDRALNTSKPVFIKVHPLTPPIVKVFKSIKMESVYGGVRVSYQNPDTAKIALIVLADSSAGKEFSVVDRYYTQTGGTFDVREFSSENIRFGIYARDSFGNRSDTVFAEITPKFEKKVPKNKLSAVHLPTDTYKQRDGGYGDGMVNLWDGITNISEPIFYSVPDQLPMWCTIDLGTKVRLARMKLYPRARLNPYLNGFPKVFEVWGTNNPSPDGSFKNWTLLGHFVSKIPSGSPPSQATQEEIEFVKVHGESFTFPHPKQTPAVRYIRIKLLQPWSNSHSGQGEARFVLAEIALWGGNHFSE